MRGLGRVATDWRSYTWNPELEEWVFDEPVEESEKDGEREDGKDEEGNDKQYE